MVLLVTNATGLSSIFYSYMHDLRLPDWSTGSHQSSPRASSHIRSEFLLLVPRAPTCSPPTSSSCWNCVSSSSSSSLQTDWLQPRRPGSVCSVVPAHVPLSLHLVGCWHPGVVVGGQAHLMCSARPDPSMLLAPHRCSCSDTSFWNPKKTGIWTLFDRTLTIDHCWMLTLRSVSSEEYKRPRRSTN